MLKLPVYPINGTYYLHTRVNGKQVKKSLRTKNTLEAKLRALKWLEHFEKMSIRTFNVNLAQGIFQAEGPEDTQQMIQFLEIAKRLELLNSRPPQPTAPQPAQQPAKADRTGLRVGELAEKFFQLKKQLKQSTALAYKTAINEFAGFIGNPLLEDVENSDVSRWLEHLSKTNETRTIDNKLGVLSSLFNFAIKHSYYHKPNPASGRKLMSKKDKTKSGYGIFEDEQIQAIFQKQHMDAFKEKDPDFYYCLMLELVTGCRISEVTSLEVSQVRNTPTYHLKIKDAKTSAGIRDIPIPQSIYDDLKTFLPTTGRAFKYKDRLGKGSGNAVSQKFKRHLIQLGIEGNKLVFHSLRKYLNDRLRRDGVSLEARSQFIGHELDSINIATYSNPISLPSLAYLVAPTQQKILTEIGYS